MLVQALEELRQTLSKKEQQVVLLDQIWDSVLVGSHHFIYTYLVDGL